MEENHVQIPRESGDGEGGTFHRYPYNELPLLKSHIHPKFAIFDAGRKLKRLEELTTSKRELLRVLTDNPRLEKVQILYYSWTQKVSRDLLANKSYNDPNYVLVYEPEEDGDNGSDDSEDMDYNGRTNRTKSGHAGGFVSRPRPRPRTRSVSAAGRFGPGRPEAWNTSAKQNAPAVVNS